MNITNVNKLSVRQWWWLLLAWWYLWAVQIRLQLSGTKWLIQHANDVIQEGSGKATDTTHIEKRNIGELMHESVRLAERCHPLSVACLGKSLVLYKMLRRRNILATFRIGVNLSKQGHANPITPLLSSHAWVEIDGVPVRESSSVQKEFIEVESR